MATLSPQLSKIILAFLLLLPWFSLYQKILFPHFAQTGFDGQIIIIAEIIFITFISVFGKHPNITKSGAYLLAAVSAWHISGFISAYLSEHFHASFIKQIEYLIHCLFAYCVWVFLGQTQKQEKMAWFLVFTFVWVVYYIYCAWSIIENPFNYSWVQGTPLFNNVRHLGYIQIAILPFLLLPLFSNIKFKWLITTVLFIVFWSSVAWGASRSTFITSLIVSFYLLFHFKPERSRLIPLFISSIVLGFFIALSFSSESSSMDPLRLLFIDSPVVEKTANEISSGRLSIWAGLITYTIERSPWFGLGADPYLFITPLLNIHVSQAHNTFIQLFSEIGLVGIICILCLIAFTVNIWRYGKPNIVNQFSRISFIGAAIASMLDGHFYHTFSLAWLMIILAISFNNAKISDTRNIRPPIILTSCLIFCVLFLQKHWNSYIQQQFPLTHESQLHSVSEFPSYYHPIQWIYNQYTNPELKRDAIELGKFTGPRICNYHLVDYLDSPSEADDKIKQLILEKCSDNEIIKTNDESLIQLLEEKSK